MKGSDKAVVLGVVMAVVLIAFYMMALSPKRQKASSLSKDVDGLKAQIAQEQQSAAFGEEARKDFPTYYGRLVVMGKAVPDQADTASLMVQLNAIANRTDVSFRGISLGSGGSSSSDAAAASSTPPPSSTGTTSTGTTPTPSESSSGSSTATPAVTAPTPATETAAANLPLGAVVGSAGLPTMPYKLNFTGTYFNVADFLNGVDDLVHLRGNTSVAADGRLLTIDGFALAPVGTGSSPKLSVSLAVTSYVAPSSEGLTAGANPTGPAPSLTSPQTQPASAAVSP